MDLLECLCVITAQPTIGFRALSSAGEQMIDKKFLSCCEGGKTKSCWQQTADC